MDSDNNLKTFLVIPDTYDGGELWGQIVRALTARDACQAVRTYLGAQDEISDFTEAKPDAGSTVWIAREFPDMAKRYGVIDCRTFKSTLLSPVRKVPRDAPA